MRRYLDIMCEPEPLPVSSTQTKGLEISYPVCRTFGLVSDDDNMLALPRYECRHNHIRGVGSRWRHVNSTRYIRQGSLERGLDKWAKTRQSLFLAIDRCVLLVGVRIDWCRPKMVTRLDWGCVDSGKVASKHKPLLPANQLQSTSFVILNYSLARRQPSEILIHLLTCKAHRPPHFYTSGQKFVYGPFILDARCLCCSTQTANK